MYIVESLYELSIGYSCTDIKDSVSFSKASVILPFTYKESMVEPVERV